MNTSQDVNDLIARLREATGPDWSLNKEIAVALGWVADPGYPGTRWRPPDDTDGPHWEMLPDFMGSLSTALRQIADDLWWNFVKGENKTTEPLYEVRLKRPEFDVGSDNLVAEAEHPTSLAICVCIAALKAKQS